VQGDRKQEWFFWCIASALFTTVVASFGIYFSVHLFVCFACLLAGISVATLEGRRARVRAEPVPAELQSASYEKTTDVLFDNMRETSRYQPF
jgi:hypothetical protein